MERYENLRNAIIMQAVEDYGTAVRKIAELNDEVVARAKICEAGYKKKNPQYYTTEEVELKRLHQINMQMARCNEIESFFNSEWYNTLCKIDKDVIITRTKEKAIEYLVKSCNVKLRKINGNNCHTKKSLKAVSEYHMVKKFLNSKYFSSFTNKDSDFFIEMLKKNVKFIFTET